MVNSREPNIQQLASHPKAATRTSCTSKSCQIRHLCQQKGVVYEAKCNLCGDKYIGQTARALHDRAREHITAAKNRTNNSALGRHYEERHPADPPSISFKILDRSRDELRLKIKEALAIKTRRPELNRRKEEMGTGYLP